MSGRGSLRQGWALLVVGIVIAILLAGVVPALVGVAMASPIFLGLIGLLAACGIGVGLLWHGGRTKWAWALLLCGPGLLLLAAVALIVFFTISYAGGL